MAKDARIATLMVDALLLERVADSIGAAALVYRAKASPKNEHDLWRMARSHRIMALLAHGRAAALCGSVLSVNAPE